MLGITGLKHFNSKTLGKGFQISVVQFWELLSFLLFFSTLLVNSLSGSVLYLGILSLNSPTLLFLLIEDWALRCVPCLDSQRADRGKEKAPEKRGKGMCYIMKDHWGENFKYEKWLLMETLLRKCENLGKVYWFRQWVDHCATWKMKFQGKRTLLQKFKKYFEYRENKSILEMFDRR